MQVETVSDFGRQQGIHWPTLKRAEERALEAVDDIARECEHLVPFDTSLVVFGSLAREEFTDASDVDWTLLVDGITIPEHLSSAGEISDALSRLENKPPGRTGTFGNLATSHNLIHFIGGEDDTNANTTRRTLLLLEAKPIGNREAFDRVRNNILKRYLEEDMGLWRKKTHTKVLHFLLNDFARYWRTMTVDFADKQHDRFHEGFALRNIKLRLSRKLLYISGLLACFEGQLLYDNLEERLVFFDKENLLRVTEFVRSKLERRPLDAVVASVSKYAGKPEELVKLVSAYEKFIAILSNPVERSRLEQLKPKEMEDDPVYAKARAVSHEFSDAVSAIFLVPDNPLGRLTIRYGVF